MVSPLLIAGLGNPGAAYAGTRHNIGFMVVEAFGDERSCTWSQPSGLFDEATTRYASRPVVLIKPMTYMNLSGTAIRKAMATHAIAPSQVIVVVDDYQFSSRIVRLHPRGSDGGLESLAARSGGRP
jgi:peptidyl-tRNA hydrolase, PTH1 family